MQLSELLLSKTIMGSIKSIVMPKRTFTVEQEIKFEQILNNATNSSGDFNINKIKQPADINRQCIGCKNKKQCSQPIYIEILQCNNHEAK